MGKKGVIWKVCGTGNYVDEKEEQVFGQVRKAGVVTGKGRTVDEMKREVDGGRVE